jgi:hypothetical protein
LLDIKKKAILKKDIIVLIDAILLGGVLNYVKRQFSTKEPKVNR